MTWYLYTVSGMEHLAGCPHMADTPGWPNVAEAVAVVDPQNPCATCSNREAGSRRSIDDGMTAQERFLATRRPGGAS